MAIPTRASRPGTFFITTATYNRRRLFQVPANAELFLETLQHYRHEGHYKLHAFVVMPDHIHLILTPQIITLERAIGMIKGGFSHRLASKLPVWQRGFTDHRIRDEEDRDTRRAYLHNNPVRANLTTAAELYPYSSAYAPPKPRTATLSEVENSPASLLEKQSSPPCLPTKLPPSCLPEQLPPSCLPPQNFPRLA